MFLGNISTEEGSSNGYQVMATRTNVCEDVAPFYSGWPAYQHVWRTAKTDNDTQAYKDWCTEQTSWIASLKIFLRHLSHYFYLKRQGDKLSAQLCVIDQAVTPWSKNMKPKQKCLKLQFFETWKTTYTPSQISHLMLKCWFKSRSSIAISIYFTVTIFKIKACFKPP